MKRTVEEHADRFDGRASTYDETRPPEHAACARLVVECARPDPEDVVLDLGTGTGRIALALASTARRVIGRDVSAEMLERARTKASERGVETVEFDTGSFREPNYSGPVDVITSNFALHHLGDAEKRDAICVMAAYEPKRVVLGDVMCFGSPEPDDPFFNPAVDDPATVGVLADAFADAGFSLTAVHRIHDQVGVLVAERGEMGHEVSV